MHSTHARDDLPVRRDREPPATTVTTNDLLLFMGRAEVNSGQVAGFMAIRSHDQHGAAVGRKSWVVTCFSPIGEPPTLDSAGELHPTYRLLGA
jgi:hypothetical protein